LPGHGPATHPPPAELVRPGPVLERRQPRPAHRRPTRRRDRRRRPTRPTPRTPPATPTHPGTPQHVHNGRRTPPPPRGPGASSGTARPFSAWPGGAGVTVTGDMWVRTCPRGAVVRTSLTTNVMPTRCPVNCILPPDILERIAQHGDERQRAAALQTLARDHSLRAIRAQNAILRAQGGKPLAAHSAEGGTPVRTIFDCASTEDPAHARVARNEGDEKSTGDVAVDEAYDGLGATYAFYWETLQRNSIDDEGLPLKGY